MENSQEKKQLLQAGAMLMILASFLVVAKVVTEIKNYRYIGGGVSAGNTISFSGHGEVTAVPDVATVYFTISKDAKTVKEAQEAVVVIEKKALEVLRAKGVSDKDIKTADASFNPKYEYKQILCTQNYCPPSTQVIVGYTANESITVKIRNTEDAGVILEGLGAVGVSNLNGPNFTIDNEDGLKAEARKKAIDNAKEKAKALAKDLDVSLGKITSFSENGNYPIMYAKADMMYASAERAPAPAELPKGENIISSDVTITYEIK